MATLADIKAKLKTKGYKNKDVTAEQLHEALRDFKYLKLAHQDSASCAEESFMNEKCIALAGTIPVIISGQEYYIPLSILVMLDHPRSAPHVYVKPTADMEIVSSQRVSRVGRVNIDYLKNWSKDNNLSYLISLMAIEFSDNCPVQARRAQSNPAPSYIASARPYNPLPPQGPYNQHPGPVRQPSYSQGPAVNSGGTELQRTLDRAFTSGVSGTRPQPQYQPQPPPPAQGNQYYEQLLNNERAHHQRAFADERARTDRAERSLREYQMVVTQAQQAQFREEQRANTLQERVDGLETDLARTKNQLEAAERGRQVAEERSRAVQRGVMDKKEQQYWIVGKDEIKSEHKQLGSGGWATVKVAKFRHMSVAAKYMHQLIISDYNRELFVREMNMAARMRHPNIVQFIGASMEGEAVILTELMPTSLRAQYAKQMLTYPQVVSIGSDVAKGLNYLHLMKPDPIIHRDISSANVLLEPLRDNKWRAKICDCGSANFAQLTNTAGPGNPTYAAPEADTPKRQSPKMDVYSYGVVLLETNTQRFPDPRTRELLFDMLGHRQDMVALIRWCMEYTITDRPSMEEVLEKLEEFEAKFKSY